MTTCEIQWIDDDGNPTPDSNPAVAMIRCDAHVYQRADGTGMAMPASKPYACCAAHLALMPSNWSIVERLP